MVVGWTDPEGSRAHIGALLLGYYTEDGRLRFDLTQIPRSPGACCRSARFEMTPSSPNLQACARKQGHIDRVTGMRQLATKSFCQRCVCVCGSR
jgi:hypothetical protein